MFYFFFIVALVYGANSGSLQPMVQANHAAVRIIQPAVSNTTAKIIKHKTVMSFLRSGITAKSFLADEGTKKSFLQQILSDPKQFVSSISDLDPTALKTIITLLKELLETSLARENELDNRVTSAEGAVNDAINVLANAEDVLTVKKGIVKDARDALEETEQREENNVLIAEENLDVKKNAESQAESDLTDKRVYHASKMADLEHAEDNRDREIGHLDDEQKILKEVIEILEGLHDNTGENCEELSDISSECELFLERDGNYCNNQDNSQHCEHTCCLEGSDPGSEGLSDCPDVCPTDYSPVCGTDGQTYSNDCEMDMVACEQGNSDLYVDHAGEC